MPRSGRNMGYTSKEVVRIFQELNRGNKDYAPTCFLCKAPGCRKGLIIDSMTGESSDCLTCQGYGFLRKD